MITVEQAREALLNIETMMDHFDFLGMTTDDEYTDFIIQISTLNQFIKEIEEKENQQEGV